MPLSSDPDARSRQLANLRSDGAVRHGAGSEALIRPLAETYLDELLEEFPAASERVLRLQARRLAKLDRLSSYLEVKGKIATSAAANVPASALEESITAAFLATQAKLEAQRRERLQRRSHPRADRRLRSPEGLMGKAADRRQQQRADRLAQIEPQIADGSLRVRQASAEEREEWANARPGAVGLQAAASEGERGLSFSPNRPSEALDA